MSIARPTALIRRAVALPMGLLDRVDSLLDAGFTRVDGALDRRIEALTDRSTSLAHGIARSAESADRALDLRISKIDSHAAARSAKTAATASRIGLGVCNFEARADAKLNRSLHTFDRATATGTRAAIATMQASVALTHRVDNQITRGFNRFDVRATNVANRAHRRQVKTLSLTNRLTARIDQRIEADFLRVDARVNAGIHNTTSAVEATIVRAAAFTNATDTRLANGVTRIDSRIDRRIAKSMSTSAATINLVNAKALAFERALDLGISRVDSRIANGKARTISTSIAVSNGITAADNGISKALSGVDRRVDRRTSQISYAFTQTSALAANRVVNTDAKLDASVANFDARVAIGMGALVAAATGISNFVADHVEDADAALTNRMSRIDARVDAFIDLTHGETAGSTNRPTSSLPWAATSLTLVLGTLGAATGASVVSANSVTTEIDTTVKIEATAAKDAVAQYLSVRDSFQALQASRSRTIQTLEQEIAAAQARITNTGLDGATIIDVADNYGGVPYVRGGTTPKGFDCSGYTSYVFRQLGVSLPRTSQSQKAWADPVSFEDRQVGDLIFWQGGGTNHVAIYAGDGMMWDSPRPGRRVGKTAIWGNPTYGRVPVEAINAAALEEVAEKTAALEEVKAQAPRLEITIDPHNLLSNSD